jgi:phosphoglycerate dehydrogenase-like enzyme
MNRNRVALVAAIGPARRQHRGGEVMNEPKMLTPAQTSHRRTRSVPWSTAILLAIGWLALFAATAQSLLAAIQIGMIGLGAIGTAIADVVWKSRAR